MKKRFLNLLLLSVLSFSFFKASYAFAETEEKDNFYKLECITQVAGGIVFGVSLGFLDLMDRSNILGHVAKSGFEWYIRNLIMAPKHHYLELLSLSSSTFGWGLVIYMKNSPIDKNVSNFRYWMSILTSSLIFSTLLYEKFLKESLEDIVIGPNSLTDRET